MDFGPYASFIYAAYGISALIIIALIAWIRIDRKTLEDSLKQLAAHGHSRKIKSARTPASSETK
ncbi:heme exporter protein CcmD [Roseibium limicola]|uniref:Heme exporter protein D n=1 Tax=Roseibium limicola TaxID=2816037 RepID=A0A939EPV1_9HYPH|nr:heme exporter protein CcmD [Roseibium limicola]MBO0346735.1 heme exporter protein CcmD [Roseibium limicola]